MPAIAVAILAKALDAHFHTKNADKWRTVSTACASDLMSDVLAFCSPKSILLTGLASPQAVRTAEVADIAAICFVLGKTPGQEAVKLAEENNIPLMTTALPLFSASAILHGLGLTGDQRKS